MIEIQILSCVLLTDVSNELRKDLDPEPVHRSFTDHNHQFQCCFPARPK